MALAWECQESLLGEEAGICVSILGLDLGGCLLFVAECCSEGSVLTVPAGPEPTAQAAALALLAEGASCPRAGQTWTSSPNLIIYLS